MVVLTLALFLPLAILARVLAGRMLHPGAVFVVVWLVVVLLPVIYYRGGWGITSDAISYLAISAAIFGLAAIVGSATRPGEDAASALAVPRIFTVNGPVLAWTMIAGTVCAFAAGLYELVRSGAALSSVLSFDGVLNAGPLVAARYYQRMRIEHANGMTSSLLSVPKSVMLAVSYTAAAVGPFLWLGQVRFRRTLLILLLVALAFNGALTTVKGSLLLAFYFVCAGAIAVRILRFAELPRITLARIVKAFAITGTIGLALIAMLFVRLGRFDSSVLPVAEDKMISYTLGYLPAFSQWLLAEDTSGGDRELGWGTASVAGVGLILGQDRYAAREYDNVQTVTASGGTTNVCTIYQGLISDFGYVGALLAVAVVGYLAGVALRRAMRKGSPTAAAVLACCYVFILLSQGSSAVRYTNVLAAMVVAVLLIRHTIRIQVCNNNKFRGNNAMDAQGADPEGIRADAVRRPSLPGRATAVRQSAR